jgi:hypothetical protein
MPEGWRASAAQALSTSAGELGTAARQLASDTALATGDIHQPQPGGYAGTDMALIDRDEDNRKR